MPAGVIGGIGLVVGVSVGAVRRTCARLDAGPSQLADSAHPPAAVLVGVRFVVWVPGRTATSQPRARAAASADIDRHTPLVWSGFSDQAPELLLSSPAPDAIPLSSSHGVGEAFFLDGAAATEGQSLLLALGRQLAYRRVIASQLLCFGCKEDVVVR